MHQILHSASGCVYGDKRKAASMVKNRRIVYGDKAGGFIDDDGTKPSMSEAELRQNI